MLRAVLRPLRTLVGAYEVYRIFQYAPSESVLDSADPACRRIDEQGVAIGDAVDPEILRTRTYAGPGSQGYGLWEGDRLMCVGWFWYGDRYRTRGFLRLRETDAKLVQLVADQEARGRGLATRLVAHASAEMRRQGYDRLFARVWHSNRASCRALVKAGWTEIGVVVRLPLFGSRARIRLKWPSGGRYRSLMREL